MNKQLENTIVEYAQKYFMESGKYIIDKNRCVDFEVYTDYNDYLEDEIIEKAFNLFDGNVEEVRDYLQEHIWECYIDYISDIENALCREAIEYIKNNLDNETRFELEGKLMLEVDSVRDILMDNNIISVYVDYTDILSRSNINLIISLENDVSIDHEFSINNFNGDMIEWLDETQVAINEGEFNESDVSLITLLKTQGYTFGMFKSEVRKYFNKEGYKPTSKFIQSLIDECYNTTSICNALVFLKNVNLNDYLNSQKITVIEKGTPCGYVDFVYGGGSTIDIVLEKEISLNGIQHEMFIDGDKYGYSFKSIYGEFIR